MPEGGAPLQRGSAAVARNRATTVRCLPLSLGQRVSPGANTGRRADPRLKAGSSSRRGCWWGHVKANGAHLIEMRVAHHTDVHVLIGALLPRKGSGHHGGANPRRDAQGTIRERLDALDGRAIHVPATLAR